MKKLLTLLFTSLMAISLALPVFAQDAASQDQGAAGQDQGAKPKKEKKHKSKKSKKGDQKMDQGGEAPKQ
jgi:hypothetical protein